MNSELQNYARKTLKNSLAQLPPDWQGLFKRMYSPGKLDRTIDEVVDFMPADKLDWAMQQVQNSLKKIEKRR